MVHFGSGQRGPLLWFTLINNVISLEVQNFLYKLKFQWLFFTPSVKRKQTAQNSARQRRDDSPANAIPIDLRRDNTSSLDVLNRMIHEVEHELEEYERCTGREVQKSERSEGLTGFTLSLVNALCRLMRYLKEVRRLWIAYVEWMKKGIKLLYRYELRSFLAPNYHCLLSGLLVIRS